jgi:hypothetical protein
MRRIALVSLALVLSTACSDSLAPVTRLAPERPRLDFMNGPSDPSPFVTRVDDDPFFLLVDSDRSTGLVSLIRLPAPGVTLIPCGGTTNLDQSSLQLVFHASGATNQLLVGRDVTAFVYDRASFNAARAAGGLCFAIATQTPIAAGLADFNAHDNDTFFSGAHADAFGWSARGIVYSLADGTALRFFDESHGVLATDGSLLNFTNSIRLTPVANQ